MLLLAYWTAPEGRVLNRALCCTHRWAAQQCEPICGTTRVHLRRKRLLDAVLKGAGANRHPRSVSRLSDRCSTADLLICGQSCLHIYIEAATLRHISSG